MGFVPAPGQRRERLEITQDAAEPVETPEEDVRNSLRNVLRVLGAVHDVVSAPIEGPLEVELPESGSVRFATAVALAGWPRGRAVPDGATLHLDVAFSGGAGRVDLAPLSLHDALGGYTPLTLERGTARAVRLRMHARIEGADSLGEVKGLRLVLSVPGPEALRAPDPALPNVLFLSIDTLRRDHLSCYGYARRTSPHLDALVARGALFDRAYSSAPWTLPSYGSLFTALSPAGHRVGVVTEREAAFGTDASPEQRTMERLRPDAVTMAEALARRGYETAAFVCNPYLGPASGIARGFHSYTSYQYNSRNGVDLVLPWLRARAQSRWFLFLHVIDPHMPYAPPPPFDTRFSKTSIADLPAWPPKFVDLRENGADARTRELSIDFYDGEIAYTDEQLGRLLAALDQDGTLANTIVVLHSDHGEELWDHGNVNHGHTQHEELLRVPLAIVWPGHVPATRVTTRVRALDLFPTLAALTGADVPTSIEGRDLAPVWRGVETADRDVVAEAVLHNPHEIQALLRQDEKLIVTRSQGAQLFDLRVDPGETEDRAASFPERVDAMRRWLLERHARVLATPRPRAELEIDARTRARLGNIGYASEDDDRRDAKPPPR